MAGCDERESTLGGHPRRENYFIALLPPSKSAPVETSSLLRNEKQQALASLSTMGKMTVVDDRVGLDSIVAAVAEVVQAVEQRERR